MTRSLARCCWQLMVIVSTTTTMAMVASAQSIRPDGYCGARDGAVRVPTSGRIPHPFSPFRVEASQSSTARRHGSRVSMPTAGSPVSSPRSTYRSDWRVGQAPRSSPLQARTCGLPPRYWIPHSSATGSVTAVSTVTGRIFPLRPSMRFDSGADGLDARPLPPRVPLAGDNGLVVAGMPSSTKPAIRDVGTISCEYSHTHRVECPDRTNQRSHCRFARGVPGHRTAALGQRGVGACATLTILRALPIPLRL